MFVAAAADLVMVFLAIETLSIATYILAGLLREEPQSQEAAFKYFMLGALSSAFFLYGIATIYGALGNTNLLTLSTLSHTGASPLLLMGMALLIVGLGFKVAVVPFHMWAPDVYEGAPTAVTAFHDGWPQSRRLCGLLARLFPGLCGASDDAKMDPYLCGTGRAHDDSGQFCGPGAKERQAYAGLLQYCACWLCVCGPGGAQCLGASSILYYLVAYTLMSLGAFTVPWWWPDPGSSPMPLRTMLAWERRILCWPR